MRKLVKQVNTDVIISCFRRTHKEPVNTLFTGYAYCQLRRQVNIAIRVLYLLRVQKTLAVVIDRATRCCRQNSIDKCHSISVVAPCKLVVRQVRSRPHSWRVQRRVNRHVPSYIKFNRTIHIKYQRMYSFGNVMECRTFIRSCTLSGPTVFSVVINETWYILCSRYLYSKFHHDIRSTRLAVTSFLFGHAEAVHFKIYVNPSHLRPKHHKGAWHFYKIIYSTLLRMVKKKYFRIFLGTQETIYFGKSPKGE